MASKKQSLNLNRTVFIVASSIVIIVVSYFIFVVPIGPGQCKKANLHFAELEQCPGEIRSNLEQVVTSTLPIPVSVPGNATEVNRVVERGSAENVTSRPLNSVVGNWLATGVNSANQEFSASFTFQNSSQYASIVNIDGFLSPPVFGKFTFSATDESFGLQPYGKEKAEYNIVETTSDSFKVTGNSETITFVRVSS